MRSVIISMMKTQYKNTIVDLLNFLIKDHRDWSWKMAGSYGNGGGFSICEIIIYEIKNNKTLGKIAYQVETGKILNMRFSGYKKVRADNAVDAMLDLISYTKRAFR